MSSGRGDGQETAFASGAFGITHPGGRDLNEDGIVLVELCDQCGLLMAVADGLGGHAAGEVASSISLGVLSGFVNDRISPDMDAQALLDLMRGGFGASDSAVKAAATGERARMGTTLAAAIVSDGLAVFGNTGDSRACIFSRSEGGRMHLRFATKDHSEVQEMVDRGLISREAARTHPLRNLVTHSVGGKFRVDTYEVLLEEGDVIVISSDGLHDYLSEEEIISCVSGGGSAEEIASRLFETGLVVTGDNISVIVKVC